MQTKVSIVSCVVSLADVTVQLGKNVTRVDGLKEKASSRSTEDGSRVAKLHLNEPKTSGSMSVSDS